MELRNLPVNLREPFAADLLTSSVVEENTNLTGNLPDYAVNAKLTQWNRNAKATAVLRQKETMLKWKCKTIRLYFNRQHKMKQAHLMHP